MNNPTVLDIALSFILHKHSKNTDECLNNKEQAIRELSQTELAAFLNEIVANEDNCPRTIDGWKEWLNEPIK